MYIVPSEQKELLRTLKYVTEFHKSEMATSMENR